MALDISVVIPTFNRAPLLGETLESVRSQTLAPREVIVVDDGSTDDTEAVAKSFGPTVRYHRIDNSGVCRARNVGVSLAGGSWIAFCDSDDTWRPDRLALQARLIEQAPQVEYVFTNFVILKDGTPSHETKFDLLPADYWNLPKRSAGTDLLVIEAPLYERLLQAQPIFPSTLLMSRAFFERVGGFDESLGRTVSEDFEFTLRCVQQGPLGVVLSPTVQIRKHASNFSRDAVGALLGEVHILELALERHPRAQLCREAIEGEIARRSVVAADFAFRCGDLDLARSLLQSLPARRRPLKGHLKWAITLLPAPLRNALSRATLALMDRARI